MSSITRELGATRTAQWYQKARGFDSWSERRRCYDALSAIAAERRAAARPYERACQPQIRIPGVLTEVAHRVYFSSHESVYKRWRARPGARQIPRWAGPDSGIAPAAAFIIEARIIDFWPYRTGVLDVAGAFDMTDVELLTAYLRSLAAWAGDRTALAACLPSGPPACVPEDMEVFAGGDQQRSSRLLGFCGTVVELLLDDPSLTPLGAFNAVRAQVTEMYPEPGRIADRVRFSMAELSDRLMRGADRGTLVNAEQARQIVTSLDELKWLLTAGFIADGRKEDDHGRR
jgi:hypothetical protein